MQYIHILITALLLGWGAAIPFGPINLEIMRRNLTYGTRFGIGLGLGASSADLTYVLLLSVGLLSLLKYPLVLQIVGILGAIILAWFGWTALKAAPKAMQNQGKKPQSVFKCWLEGYLLTLVNPFTILFWASVSAQLVSLTLGKTSAIWYASLGVILGTVSWIFVFNGILHLTRHKLTLVTEHRLNRIGGLILLLFAAYSAYMSLHGIL